MTVRPNQLLAALDLIARVATLPDGKDGVDGAGLLRETNIGRTGTYVLGKNSLDRESDPQVHDRS